jgi:hypothetical protein
VAFDASSIAGPAGAPLGQTAAVGPTGTALGAGSAGPAGTSIDSGAGIASAGTPLARAGTIVRRHPVAAIVGAAVVVTVAIGTVVVAAGGDGDAPTSAPPATATADATVATTSVTPVETSAAVVTLDSVASTTASPTSDAVAETVADACVAGTWIGENESIAGAFTQLFGGGGIELQGITGTVHVTIGDDGTVVATFDQWVIAANIAGAGTATVTVDGFETSTIDFADGGSYTVTSSQIESRMRAEAMGVVLVDGSPPDALFQGSNAFRCADDVLEVTRTGIPADYVMTFHRDG